MPDSLRLALGTLTAIWSFIFGNFSNTRSARESELLSTFEALSVFSKNWHIAFRSRAWWLAGTRSTEPAQRAALERLDLDPLVDYGLRLGEGTGALVALPVLAAAGATLREMATFDEAGVSDREA